MTTTANTQLAQFIYKAITEIFPTIEVSTLPSVEVIEKNLIAPKDEDLADICLPCFIFSKSLKSKPEKIATDIATSLQKKITDNQNNNNNDIPIFISAASAVAGYLNFRFTP